MIITKKTLSRREMLRAAGAAVALPFLDSMVPAFGGSRAAAATAVRRLGVVYVPNGMMMPFFTPATEGAGFEFKPILRPLEPFRDHLRVISGLNGAPSTGAHAGASTRFLTAVSAKRSDSELVADVSMDQFAARELGRHTQFASLELALEGRDFAGSCDIGFSCGYTNTIAWRSATTPLPMENDPRVVFERLFGEGGTTDAKVRAARLRADRSILDSVLDKTTSLQQRLGTKDRSKLSDYLEAIRDVERRIQLAEAQSANDVALPVVAQPAGVPSGYDEHAKLMFDLQVLAYQSDLTRVITFMMGREISGRTYPEIGVNEAHHPISHHQNDQTKIATVAKINTFHMTLFCVLPGEAARDPGRRRLAARSHAAPLRVGHVRQQRAFAERPAAPGGGRRRRAGTGRASPEIPERAARQSAPEPPRQARRADREDREQRRTVGVGLSSVRL